MKRKIERRIVVIDKKFQYNLIIKFLIVNCLVMLAFSGAMYLFLQSEVQSNLYSAHVTYTNMQDMLFPIILILSFMSLFISSILISVYVLYASHKIAGPLYRFNKTLEEIYKGNLKPFLATRDKDQLKDIAKTLELMTTNIAKDLRAIKKVKESLYHLNQTVKSEELQKEIDVLKEVLEYYSYEET